MLSKPHVRAALEAKRESFVSLDLRQSQEVERYRRALARLEGLGRAELEALLAGIPRPGALPSAERVAGQPLVRPFGRRWANHEEARAWARSILEGVTTLAVDGSQITPSGDFSIPVGAVQVGRFENPHRAEGRYIKEIHFEVLPPDELEAQGAEETEGFPDLQVNLRRFELECRALVEFMGRAVGRQPAPLCFFDGSLILSFAAHLRPELRGRYLRAMRGLIAASEATRVPLVGYVDNSRAQDLVSLLRWLGQETERPQLSDGDLLRSQMAWGDRSEALICARDDRLFEGADATLDYYGRVAFVYLKTTAENPPARLELPRWLLEAGALERVVDLVRAECIVGTGYPYALETADAVAVLTAQDREQFYRAFQEFSAQLGLALRYARKAYSKRGRR